MRASEYRSYLGPEYRARMERPMKNDKVLERGPWRWALGGHGSSYRPHLLHRGEARSLLSRGACRRCVLFLRTFGQPYPWKCARCACRPTEFIEAKVAAYVRMCGHAPRRLFNFD